MRYALSETEWKIIQPILPTKSRGVPRVDDRRVLNGIFWVLLPKSMTAISCWPGQPSAVRVAKGQQLPACQLATSAMKP